MPSGPAVNKALEYVKGQNEKYRFLNNLTHRIGFPYWDKSMVFTKQYAAKGSSADSESIIFIPFVRDTQQVVNAALRITMTSKDTSFKFLYDWQYDDTAATGMEKRGLALLLMSLDKNVFGKRLYEITDSSLFGENGHRAKYVQISGEPQAGNTKAKYVYHSLTICYSQFVPAHEGQLVGCPPGSPCNGYVEEYTCISESWLTWEDDGSGGSPPPPPTDPGSGGSGGTGDPGTGWVDPCAGSGGVTTVSKGQTAQPCGGNPGWVPVPPGNGNNTSSGSDPCTTAQNAAKKMDSIFSLSNADSVLKTIPNLANESLEKGFPIYRKFSVNPYNKTDTTFINYYKPDNVQTGDSNHINITASIPYLYVWAAMLHTHPANGYKAHSATDIYSIIENQMNKDSHFEGSFVAASDGSQYVITITDYSKAAAFFNTKSVYLDTAASGWKEDSDIGKAFEQAKNNFEDKFKGNSNAKNLAYEMAMAAVLKQFDVGITLNKKNSSGNFIPIVVNTIIPNPNKPKKKVYTQDCL